MVGASLAAGSGGTEMALDVKRRRFTAEEYDEMGRAGILGEDDRVEIIEGEIVEMNPIGDRHLECVVRLADLLYRHFADMAFVSTQNPIRLGKRSEPQPDLVLLRRQPSPFGPGHPKAEDVLLLVEVADTTAEFDRRIKLPLYARAGIAEVWIVDLAQQIVTAHSNPTGRGYRGTRLLRRGDQITSGAFPERPLAVDDFLTD
jgi:Uma2 family endonuclease